MKKTLLYTLAGAFALGCVVETAPTAKADSPRTAPRTLEQLRADVRLQAMENLAASGVETVSHRRWHHSRHYHHRPRWVPRRHTLRYIHRPGRWCSRGGWYGRRCTYTPRVLRPFRR